MLFPASAAAPSQSAAGEDPAPTVLASAPGISAAYNFLGRQMDQFHTCFYVYDDRDSGAVNFAPGGWMGDLVGVPDEIAKTVVNDACTEAPYRGTTCIKITYPEGIDTQNWVGIYWLWPDGNWGEQPGYDYDAARWLPATGFGGQAASPSVLQSPYRV